MITAALLIVGATIIGFLALAHGWYTFLDSRKPFYLAPRNTELIDAMKLADLRLSRGGTTMWNAWLGFNFSHALGVLLFAIGCIVFALSLPSRAAPRNLLLIPVFVGALYLCLALRYWFWKPALGIAIGTLCFSVAWVVY